MWTNIILKIKNQKELNEVEKIVFENGGKWLHEGTNYMPISYLYDDGNYIMISKDKFILRLFTEEIKVVKEEKQATEINTKLFIDTKGSYEYYSVLGMCLKQQQSKLFGNPKPSIVVDEFVIKIGDKRLMGINITKDELLTIIKEVEE